MKIVSKYSGWLSQKKTVLLVIFAYLLLPIMAYWRNLDFSGLNLTFFNADFIGFYFPDFAQGTQLVRDIWHLSPRSNILWDPYNLLGLPLVGAVDRIGFFYPVKFLFYLVGSFFPFKYSIFFASYYSIFHLSLAAIFTYLFTRRCLKLDPFPSFIIGLIYSLGGSLAHLTIFSNSLVGPAYLPLELFFLWTALEKKSYKYSFFAGLSLAPILLAGYFPMFFYNNIFIVLLLFFYFGKDKESVLRACIYLGIANSIAILVSAVVLIPNMELMRLTERQMYNLGGSASYPFGADNLLNYFIPHFAGVDKSGTVFGYIGVVSLFFLLYTLRSINNRRTIIFVLAALLFFVLSLGNATVLHAFAYKLIPLYSSFRRTSFLHYIVTFNLAILVGFAIHHLSEQKKGLEEVAAPLGNVLKGLFLLWIILFILKPFTVTNAVSSAMMNEMISTIFLTIVFLAASFVVLKYSSDVTTRSFKILLVIILAIDLFTLIAKNTTTNSDYDPRLFNSKSAVIDKVDDNLAPDHARVYLHEPTLRYNSALEKISQIDGYYGLTLKYYGLLMNHYKDKDGWIMPTSPLLDILGVRYIFTTRPLINKENNTITLKHVETEKLSEKDSGRFLTANGTKVPIKTPINVYENLDYLPRARLVGHVETVKGDVEALKMLDKINIKENAVVTTNEKLPETATGQNNSTVKITEYNNARIKITAESLGRSFLVLSDSYYPGWRAYVDGHSTPIYRTNIALRGIYLEDGPHTIIFKYQPLSFYVGFIVSLLSSVAIGLYLFLRPLRK